MSTKVYTDISELSDQVVAFQSAVSAGGLGRHVGICGFDGFIDTFIRMVEPSTMADWGPRVSAAAGIAASYVSEHQGDKFGGNGPLLSAALSDIFSNQIDLSYIGAMGEGGILPIFQEALGEKVSQLYTLVEPAHSDCLEFDDGKLMLCDMRSCAEITWERLIERVGADTLDAHLKASGFIAAVNWGKLPNVGVIWQNLAQRLGELGRPAKEVIFFMDLAEFEQRPMADRESLIPLISGITRPCHTILSFNLKEAWQMADTLGGAFAGRKDPDSVAECTAYLKSRIEVDRVIVHPNDGAACASADGCVYIPGPYCRKPLISTGAGDNFGAGCLAASLEGWDDLGLLLAGNCASGYFVRSGRSASFADMCRMLDAWLDGNLGERL